MKDESELISICVFLIGNQKSIWPSYQNFE